MRKFLLAIIALVGLAASANAEVYEIEGSRFAAGGNWSGHAFADNQTGNFVGCMIATQYTSGHVLLFSATASDRFVMFVSHPTWRLPVGATYPNEMMIDGVPFNRGTARVINSNQVAIELSTNDLTFRGFLYGNVLTLQSINLRLRLSGTNIALRNMVSCWDRHINGSGNAPASNNPYNRRSY